MFLMSFIRAHFYIELWTIDDLLSISKVKCGVRGDLGPACNAAGMIDRKLLGIKHLYKKPVFRNLKVMH